MILRLLLQVDILLQTKLASSLRTVGGRGHQLRLEGCYCHSIAILSLYDDNVR